MLPSPDSPILLSLGSFLIRWYSVCLLLGVLGGLWFALKRAKKVGVHEDHIYNLSFWSVLMGLIGARIFAVLYEPSYYFAHPIEIPQVWHGGLAIHGGIVFAAITIAIYCKIKKLKLFTMLDLLTPSLLIGQIIGRFGNYFNQEAYGTPTSLPWGIYIAPENRYEQYGELSSYHPTFLYEGLWNLLVLFILLKIEKSRKLKPGSLTALYLVFYGVGRGLLEFIRTDAAWWGTLRVVHWLSILLIIVGTSFLVIRKRSYK